MPSKLNCRCLGQRAVVRPSRRACVVYAAATATKTVKIGTRGSPLALAQAYLTRDLLKVSSYWYRDSPKVDCEKQHIAPQQHLQRVVSVGSAGNCRLGRGAPLCAKQLRWQQQMQ